MKSARRLQGLALSRDGKLAGLIVLLSDAGLKDRAGTVADLAASWPIAGSTAIARFCREAGHHRRARPPRWDRREPEILSRDARHLPGAALLLDQRLEAVAVGAGFDALGDPAHADDFKRAGGEMNFILGALAVMVMVFTLEASIHVIHYYKASRGARDPMSEALRLCWKPCLCRCSDDDWPVLGERDRHRAGDAVRLRVRRWAPWWPFLPGSS